MGKKDKLIERLKAKPKDFTFDEAETLLNFFDYIRSDKGKTSRRRGVDLMNNTIEYKGYIGSIEFSEEDGVFHGKVQGIRALISYEGTNAQELVEYFHTAVDDYLVLCEEESIEPEKAYKGSFNVRISPELHKKAVVYAYSQQVSLNKVMEDALNSYIVDKEK